jgi:hypothetical protein
MPEQRQQGESSKTDPQSAVFSPAQMQQLMTAMATMMDQRFRENDENIDARLKTIAGDLCQTVDERARATLDAQLEATRAIAEAQAARKGKEKAQPPYVDDTSTFAAGVEANLAKSRDARLKAAGAFDVRRSSARRSRRGRDRSSRHGRSKSKTRRHDSRNTYADSDPSDSSSSDGSSVSSTSLRGYRRHHDRGSRVEKSYGRHRVHKHRQKFEPDVVGYFDPNSDKITTSSKGKTIYRSVYEFIDSARYYGKTNSNTNTRRHLPKCFQGEASTWFTSLSDEEKDDLRGGDGIERWIKALTDQFGVDYAQAWKKLNALKFGLYELHQGTPIKTFIYECIRWAKEGRITETKDQITQAWMRINPRLTVFLTAPTPSTTVSQFTAQAEAKVDEWLYVFPKNNGRPPGLFVQPGFTGRNAYGSRNPYQPVSFAMPPQGAPVFPQVQTTLPLAPVANNRPPGGQGQ